MSILALNAALKIKGYSPTAKFILVVLANYADEFGSCFPSHSHIADIVGLKDTKGVARYIKQFEEDGLLVIQKRKDDNGGYISNRYVLNITDNYPMGISTTREGVREPLNTKEDTKENIYSSEFETFWKKYPRKIAKKKTYNIFRKIPTSEFKSIMQGLDSLMNKTTDLKFIPYPVTFLNQERWKDEDEAIKTLNTKKGSLNRIAG